MDLETFSESRPADSMVHTTGTDRFDNERAIDPKGWRIIEDKRAYKLPTKLEGTPHTIHRIRQSASYPAAGEGHGSGRDEEAEGK